MINYDEEFNKIINEVKGNKKKLLLHSCCAPCSSHVITLLVDYFDITVLYYNPNIEPIEEYEKRKSEQLRLIEILNKKHNIKYMECDYENEEFKNVAKGLEKEAEGHNRCSRCYFLRLKKTAALASMYNFDYFATTLTVSPYKDMKKINKMGKVLEAKYNVKYLYSDFKKHEGYKLSIELSKQYNLYRQNYCGCLYAKKD